MGTPPPGPESNRIRVDKSPVFAFFLTFLFGPLGLLYVKVVPALVLILAALGGYFTFGIGSTVARLVWIVAWIVSIVWACVEASRRHPRVRALAGFHRRPRHTGAGLPTSCHASVLPRSGCSSSSARLVPGCRRCSHPPVVGRQQVDR